MQPSVQFNNFIFFQLLIYKKTWLFRLICLNKTHTQFWDFTYSSWTHRRGGGVFKIPAKHKPGRIKGAERPSSGATPEQLDHMTERILWRREEEKLLPEPLLVLWRKRRRAGRSRCRHRHGKRNRAHLQCLQLNTGERPESRRGRPHV